MMNMIKIEDNKVFLKDNSANYLNVDYYQNIKVIVSKNVSCKLIIVGTSNYDMTYELEDNSRLIVNSLNKDNSVTIEINLNKDSYIEYNHSVLGNNDSENTFNIHHLKDNSTSILNNNGINRRDTKLFFMINGIIPKKLSNIICNQSSRIINFAYGESKIIPNLIIDSNDIIANHSAYVGEIDENTKFYLASRGIKDKEIEKLIYKATLFGKMDLSIEKEEFSNLINEWW